MTRRVVTTLRADDDIAAAVDYYLNEGAPDAALAFVDELEIASNVIAQHPSIGSPRFAVVTGIAQLRSVGLQRFPYLVFYTDDADAVRVHRVLHTSRDVPTEIADQA